MSTVLRQDTFQCYQYYKQPSSLIQSVLNWIAIHLSLLILYLPLSIILYLSLLLSNCFIKRKTDSNEQHINIGGTAYTENNSKCPTLKLLCHPAVIYLFTASLLLILYIIDVLYDIIKHLHVEEFYTLTPYVLFILFKDAVVYSLNMRKALLPFIFGDIPCCQCYVRLFEWILKNYWIYGIKMNPNLHRSPQHSNYISLDYKRVPLCYNLPNLHKIYSVDEYILFIISAIAGIAFVFLSFSYYIYTYHQQTEGAAMLWTLFVIGIVFKILTVLCVARFIELIFQGFATYYQHMADLRYFLLKLITTSL